LTTVHGVVIIANMDAELMLNERHVIRENAFVEVVVWRLRSPVSGSSHKFKYRLAFVVNGVCVLRFDNEAGKGDHKHGGENETPYNFTSPENLLKDFWKEVDGWGI
jgi:hypothetical protein